MKGKSFIQYHSNHEGLIMEEYAWLNVQIVEAKLPILGKLGRWLVAQTKLERRWS
jgi:hypothetical protein